uniref:Uncharacterized protein n=1 Tax=Oryza glumipatula TaxID=40148 RepID=A0A0D9ZHN8_9ORYZ
MAWCDARRCGANGGGGWPRAAAATRRSACVLVAAAGGRNAETTFLVPTPLYSSASSHSNPESIAEAKADANADYEEGDELVLPPEVGTKLQSKPLKCPELQIPWKQPTQQQEVSQTGKTGEEVSRMRCTGDVLFIQFIWLYSVSAFFVEKVGRIKNLHTLLEKH